jgi:hypothetical protein
MKESLQVNIKGRMVIRDVETNEVCLDQCNAIHPQNMASVIARALSRDPNGYIYFLSFGNGGTFLNTNNQLVFRPPNTIGAANLYNPTYTIQVDEQSSGTPATNSTISAQSTPPAITSVITITAQLNANEPSGQAVADNITTNVNGATKAPFIFDEVGLKSSDGLLLSHLVFTPFEKTANRAFLIIYTLTVSVS